MNRKTITYHIPVCTECNDTIKARKAFWTRIGILGLVILTAAVLLLVSKTNALNTIGLLVTVSEWFNSRSLEFTAGVLIIISILMMGIAMDRGAAKIVSGNWAIKFYNKEFQKAFAELNPHLVKNHSKRKNDLVSSQDE